MASPDDDIALSDLQLDLMRVLWRGEASVADVAAELARTRGLAHTTVATLLTRLRSPLRSLSRCKTHCTPTRRTA